MLTSIISTYLSTKLSNCSQAVLAALYLDKHDPRVILLKIPKLVYVVLNLVCKNTDTEKEVHLLVFKKAKSIH